MVQLNQNKLVTLFGVLFLIIGIGMFSYSINLIEEHKQTINTTEVTLDQLWNPETSSNWWKNVCITLVLPLTAVFISIGGITLTAQGIMPAIQHNKIKANSEKIKIEIIKNQEQIEIKQENP